MLLEFEINTKPVPQARPRFYVRYSGLRQYVGAYDPKNCKDFKEAVAWHARIIAYENRIRQPLEGPISISLIFKMGKNGNGKDQYHIKRPDLDNLAKAVKDALKGIIYADDSQIIEAHLYKSYGEPSIKVEIQTVD